MTDLHLDEFIAQHSELNLKANTIRKWLALWNDKPSKGYLSPEQQAIILSYVENVSSGQMSQDDFVQRVRRERLSQQASQSQTAEFEIGSQFIEAERSARMNDGFSIGQRLAEDFMFAVDSGFAAALPKVWNQRFADEKSPYRVANHMIHSKLDELRSTDAQRFGMKLRATPFALNPDEVLMLDTADD